MPTDDLVEAARRALLPIPGLSSYFRDFCLRMYSSPQANYQRRLRMIGLEKLECVLDAGCGFGQWSLAMASLGNARIHACDIDPDRITAFSSILAQLGETRIEPAVSSLESLPYPEASFDAVFAYGCVHAAEVHRCLDEFHRVLKPGGTVYFTMNAFGYYAQRWLEEKPRTADHNPKLNMARIFMSTAMYQKTGKKVLPYGQIFEKEEMRHIVEKHGFSNIRINGEGETGLHGEEPFPFFPSSYRGMDAVYEVLAAR